MVEVDILGMRYLGVDYGTRRMGIAVSDDGGRIAFPQGVVSAHTDLARLREILRIIKRERIGTVILGIPLDTAGRERDTARRVRAFRVALEKQISIPIVFENEILTTRLAESDSHSRTKIDAAAAAIILQSYLDTRARSAE